MTLQSRSRLHVAACLLACALPGTAVADGMSYGPAAPGRVDWSGLHVGAHLGGGAMLSDMSNSAGPSVFGNPLISPAPLAGVQIGYSFQSGDIVYGFEADVSFPDDSGTGTCSALSGSFINSTCKVETDAFGTLTGKLGLAVGEAGRGLIYGKAGAAWMSGELHTATNDATMGFVGNFNGSRTESLRQWGWTLGAGTEYALSGNWSVAAEYDYLNFGTRSVTLMPSAFLDNAGVITGTVPARQGSVSQEMHLFKIGLNYRFGDGLLADGVAEAPSRPTTLALRGFSFDLGGRYWYSWGRHKYDLGLIKGTADPTSSISRLTYGGIEASTGEMFGRVSAPWNLFAKGFIGGGNIHGGKMNDEDFGIPASAPGQIVPYTNTLSSASGDVPLYGTIDVGYDFWRTANYRFGAFVGYNYYKEALNAYGCRQTANAIGPCSPAEGGPVSGVGHAIIDQRATWQSMRLGAAGEFYLVPGLKVSAEAAYLPYVNVRGRDHHYFGNTPTIASINPLTGYGTGAQVEAMLSYDVTENISVGVGARYWGMFTKAGSFRRTYDAPNVIPAPQLHQSTKLDTERVGVLGELTYRFD